MTETLAYGTYITNEILSKHVENWSNVPCDLSYDKCKEIYIEFTETSEIQDHGSEYDQLVDFIQRKYLYEQVTVVECGTCAAYQEQSVDEQRKHFESEYLGTTDVSEDDIYVCHSCGSLVMSKYERRLIREPFYELTKEV